MTAWQNFLALVAVNGMLEFFNWKRGLRNYLL